MRRTRFASFAWGVLAYNVIVVLWGAVVRASRSGDGCGAHWPFCDGKLIPHTGRFATVIEYGHRLSTGVVLLLVFGLCAWAFRQYPKGHRVRLGASLSVGFTLSEALIGAILVLFGLVANNNSVNRAVAMSMHLVNTVILLLCLTLTAWWSSGGRTIRLRNQGAVGLALYISLAATLFLALSGAITALVDTLYPATSLWEALKQDIFPGAHFLIRLRLLHPFIAIAVGLYTIFTASMVRRLRETPDTRRFAGRVIALFLLELAMGLCNVLALAPIWMQVVHLLLADLLWINLVLLAAAALPANPLDAPLSAGERETARAIPSGIRSVEGMR